MTGKTFLNSVANGKTDVVQLLLSMLDECGASSGPDLRIQLQTDPRYQEFISRDERHVVLEYEMSNEALPCSGPYVDEAVTVTSVGS